LEITLGNICKHMWQWLSLMSLKQVVTNISKYLFKYIIVVRNKKKYIFSYALKTDNSLFGHRDIPSIHYGYCVSYAVDNAKENYVLPTILSTEFVVSN